MKANGMKLSNTAIKKEVVEIKKIIGTISVIGTKYKEVQDVIDRSGGEKEYVKEILRIAKYAINRLEEQL